MHEQPGLYAPAPRRSRRSNALPRLQRRARRRAQAVPVLPDWAADTSGAGCLQAPIWGDVVWLDFVTLSDGRYWWGVILSEEIP